MPTRSASAGPCLEQPASARGARQSLAGVHCRLPDRLPPSPMRTLDGAAHPARRRDPTRQVDRHGEGLLKSASPSRTHLEESYGRGPF